MNVTDTVLASITKALGAKNSSYSPSFAAGQLDAVELLCDKRKQLKPADELASAALVVLTTTASRPGDLRDRMRAAKLLLQYGDTLGGGK